MPLFLSARVAGVKTIALPKNDIRLSDRRHPVDFLDPLPTTDNHLQRICEVLSRTFGWVAEADTVEQKGLRASVVLHCVRADLIGEATLEELGARRHSARQVRFGAIFQGGAGCYLEEGSREIRWTFYFQTSRHDRNSKGLKR